MSGSIAPGCLITPHIRLVAPLSRGAMGEIWVADHLTLSTQVAVKLIVDELTDVAHVRERFEREARLAAQLDTPHVVRHFDHGVTDDGRPYIVMELLHGQALDERFGDGALPRADSLKVLEEVGTALECAASRGIVHRDVKPENIFLCDSPSGFFCKLLDFGVSAEPSRNRSALTLPGTLVGTPGYMSPETVLGIGKTHHQDDLWALAAVAYECLLGVQPFRGNTTGAICTAIANRQYTRPSDIDDDLGPRLDGFFAQAFAERREDRFASVSDMLTSLHHALAGQTVPRSSAALPAPPERLLLPGGRSRDTVRPVTSIELPPGILPTFAERWGAPIAGLVTVSLLALPLVYHPGKHAGRAATGWSTLVASAASIASDVPHPADELPQTPSPTDEPPPDPSPTPPDHTPAPAEAPPPEAPTTTAQTSQAMPTKTPERGDPEPTPVATLPRARAVARPAPSPAPEDDYPYPDAPPNADTQLPAPRQEPAILIPRRDLGF